MANIILRQNQSRIILSAERGKDLLSVLREAGFAPSSPCGGNGTCGKCKIMAEGNLSAITSGERKFLSEEEIAMGVRLACHTKIEGDCFVSLLKSDPLAAQTNFQAESYRHAPLVTVKRTEENTSFYIEDVLIFEDETDAKNLGLAVDIGTTTVAVYLCDMERGRILGTCGFRNPQCAFGADVISRIDKIMKDDAALADQQKRILDAVLQAGDALANAGGATRRDIRAAVFCGNTVMQHIAAGINPSSIANAPFTAPTLFGYEISAEELGLSFAKGANIYFPPCFASYVGGDIACGIVATGLDHTEKTVLFIDIGTNGEIGLSVGGTLYFCSAAAGPAFEGAHIRHGMSGVAGAISRVFIEDHRILYETIGQIPPVGICGSGIVDACAVMLEAGLLDETGAILDIDEAGDFAEYLRETEDGTVFMLDEKQNIFLTGKDIREIQLAKAAIAAGVRTLLRKAEIAPSKVDAVVLAGGFGSHIDADHACRIGLIPREFQGRVHAVGNVAGAGAVAYLMSKDARNTFDIITARADYTELSGDAFFMETYIDEMMFEEE